MEVLIRKKTRNLEGKKDFETAAAPEKSGETFPALFLISFSGLPCSRSFPEKTSRFFLLVAVVVALIIPSQAGAVTFVFDYTYDSQGFFSGENAWRRTHLENAAGVFEAALTSVLAAIVPEGGNTWAQIFYSPDDISTLVRVENAVIPANAILVYAGGADLGASGPLGMGGPGGYEIQGNWVDTILYRGQDGTSETLFSTWGGSLTFNTAANWHFDPDPSTVEPFPGQNDFYSVAIHELGHLLGIGTSALWSSMVVGQEFHGTYSMTIHGAPVPVGEDGSHWADDTTSLIPDTKIRQQAAMTSSLLQGSRKYFTELDFAALKDLGWELVIIPEPTSISLLVMAFLGCAVFFRRTQRR